MQQLVEHPDGLYFGLPEDDYHADPALGSSDIKALLMAPEAYWGQSYMNPLYERKDTVATVRGSAYHKFILEGEAAYEASFVVEPEQAMYDDALVTVADLDRVLKARGLKTDGVKADKITRLREAGYGGPIWDEIVQRFREENAEAVHIPAAMDLEIRYMARFITSNPHLGDAFKGGFPEVSVLWTLSCGTRCKARVDYLKAHIAVDLKTYSNRYGARADVEVEKNAANNRHDLQAAWYSQGLLKAQEFAARDNIILGDGERIPDSDWLKDFTSPVPIDLYYVYQQTNGVPMARARRWNPKMETFKTALQECEVALHIYRSCMEEFGTDLPWIRAEAPCDYSDEPFSWIRR